MAAEAVDWPHEARVDLGEDMVRAKGVAVILKSTITPPPATPRCASTTTARCTY